MSWFKHHSCVQPYREPKRKISLLQKQAILNKLPPTQETAFMIKFKHKKIFDLIFANYKCMYFHYSLFSYKCHNVVNIKKSAVGAHKKLRTDTMAEVVFETNV